MLRVSQRVSRPSRGRRDVQPGFGGSGRHTRALPCVHRREVLAPGSMKNTGKGRAGKGRHEGDKEREKGEAGEAGSEGRGKREK